MSITNDEARQLVWRLWTVAPDYTWLIVPNQRSGFEASTSPRPLRSTRHFRHWPT